jgi:RNA polymerase sigma factor (sigma-70 family)
LTGPEWAKQLKIGELATDPVRLFVLWAVSRGLFVTPDEFYAQFDEDFPIAEVLDDLERRGFLTERGVITPLGEEALLDIAETPSSANAPRGRGKLGTWGVSAPRRRLLKQGEQLNEEAVTLLLGRLQNGDQGAREGLLSIAQERIALLVRKQLRSFPSLRLWESSEDVLQEVQLRLWRAMEQVHPVSARQFYALASAFIRRQLLDDVRSIGRKVQPKGPVPSKTKDPGGFEPRAFAEWAEFHSAIESLPTELREVVDLVWYFGLTQNESAKILGVSTKTVARRWREAGVALAPYIP